MEKLISKACNSTHSFTIVDEIPYGYFVWNIGRANFDFPCYVPLAEQGALPHHVNPDTLLAIRVKDEETALRILRRASRRGVDRRTFLDMAK